MTNVRVRGRLLGPLSSVIRNHKKLTAVVGLVGSVILLSELLYASASARGQLVANFDMARGHYQILGYGLPTPERGEYVRPLRERYGIEFRAVAFCRVSHSLVSYANAYNDVVRAGAVRKFGHDVFRECNDDVRASRERRAPMAKQR